MKLPRNLSGEDLVKHLCKCWGYRRIHQVGSHVVLQTEQLEPHRIAVPAHTPLKIGTLNGIVFSIAAHKSVSKEDILKDL
jgi:predicted RNA binding protein YcfA (HicA-like mRNA interferase family)